MVMPILASILFNRPIDFLQVFCVQNSNTSKPWCFILNGKTEKA